MAAPRSLMMRGIMAATVAFTVGIVRVDVSSATVIKNNKRGQEAGKSPGDGQAPGRGGGLDARGEGQRTNSFSHSQHDDHVARTGSARRSSQEGQEDGSASGVDGRRVSSARMRNDHAASFSSQERSRRRAVQHHQERQQQVQVPLLNRGQEQVPAPAAVVLPCNEHQQPPQNERTTSTTRASVAALGSAKTVQEVERALGLVPQETTAGGAEATGSASVCIRLDQNLGTADEWARYGCPPSTYRDLAACERAVAIDGARLELCDEVLRANKILVETAIRNNPLALQFAHRSLRDSREVVQLACDWWQVHNADDQDIRVALALVDWQEKKKHHNRTGGLEVLVARGGGRAESMLEDEDDRESVRHHLRSIVTLQLQPTSRVIQRPLAFASERLQRDGHFGYPFPSSPTSYAEYVGGSCCWPRPGTSQNDPRQHASLDVLIRSNLRSCSRYAQRYSPVEVLSTGTRVPSPCSTSASAAPAVLAPVAGGSGTTTGDGITENLFNMHNHNRHLWFHDAALQQGASMDDPPVTSPAWQISQWSLRGNGTPAPESSWRSVPAQAPPADMPNVVEQLHLVSEKSEKSECKVSPKNPNARPVLQLPIDVATEVRLPSFTHDGRDQGRSREGLALRAAGQDVEDDRVSERAQLGSALYDALNNHFEEVEQMQMQDRDTNGGEMKVEDNYSTSATATSTPIEECPSGQEHSVAAIFGGKTNVESTSDEQHPSDCSVATSAFAPSALVPQGQGVLQTAGQIPDSSPTSPSWPGDGSPTSPSWPLNVPPPPVAPAPREGDAIFAPKKASGGEERAAKERQPPPPGVPQTDTDAVAPHDTFGEPMYVSLSSRGSASRPFQVAASEVQRAINPASWSPTSIPEQLSREFWNGTNDQHDGAGYNSTWGLYNGCQLPNGAPYEAVPLVPNGSRDLSCCLSTTVRNAGAALIAPPYLYA